MNSSSTEYHLFNRFFLQPLGLTSQNVLVFWLLLLAGSITLGGLWYYQGNIFAVLFIIYFMTIFLLSFTRLDYSLYILMFGALIFDQDRIPRFPVNFTFEVEFFRNLKDVPYLPAMEFASFSAAELHMFIIIFALLVMLSVKSEFSFRSIPVFWPFIIFFCFFAWSFVYGMMGGGDFLPALWEVRALCYFCILYVIVPQIIRTKQQIKVMVWIFMIAISFKAFQAIGRFVDLGFTTGGFQTLTNHGDPVFTVTLIVLLLGFIVFKVKDKQKIWLLLLLIPLLLGFYVGVRRAAYASLIVSLITFVMLLPRDTLWRFVKYAIPCLIIGAIYTTAFWNSSSTIGRPVQLIKSGIVEPEEETNYEDYHSNMYRNFENYNLAQTVVNNPIKGIGFGKKYEQPLPLVRLSFELRDYIPHNEIYWVLVKMGGVGFLAFWFFFNSFVAKGVITLYKLTDPYLRVVLCMVIIAIINQMVVSFFDLQLTYYRNMIYLGCVMGLLSAISHSGLQSTLATQTSTNASTEV